MNWCVKKVICHLDQKAIRWPVFLPPFSSGKKKMVADRAKPPLINIEQIGRAKTRFPPKHFDITTNMHSHRRQWERENTFTIVAIEQLYTLYPMGYNHEL